MTFAISSFGRRNSFPSIDRSLPSGRKPISRVSNHGRRAMRVESLETRELLSVSISIADATLDEIASASAFVAPGSGGLDGPGRMTLGPDGNLYVTGNNVAGSGAVRRYNATTGQYINTFVSQGSGGLSGVRGLAFGPDGNLYVASANTDEVLRYNGSTGAFIDEFVTAGLGGIDTPDGLTFGADGNLYVSNSSCCFSSSPLPHSILRYQGPLAAAPGSPLPASGQSGATFATASEDHLFQPVQLIFGPDGNLYVGGNHDGVSRFDGTTGAFLDTFVPNGSGNLAAARALVVRPPFAPAAAKGSRCELLRLPE